MELPPNKLRLGVRQCFLQQRSGKVMLNSRPCQRHILTRLQQKRIVIAALRVGVVALVLPQNGQEVMGVRLPDLVARLTVQIEYLEKFGVGQFVAVELGVGVREVPPGAGLLQ